MPRRSSGGRSSYRARPAPARPAPARSPPPQTVNHAPPPATAQPQRSGGGFGSVIADGMAWGTGNAIAHRVMDTVMGPRTVKHETVVSEAAPASAASPVVNGMGSASASPVANSMGSASCDTQSKAFMECVNNYGSDISKCQFYMDMLSECKKNSGSMMAA